ncbi:MAG TPA: hypothetical protein DIU35_19380 [Candidatus Latescibacteria bacterium]|nr:hypothetical protein [Candidatus Latescibacterota bacterium]
MGVGKPGWPALAISTENYGMKSVLSITALIFGIFVHQLASAGAWTLPKGHFWTKATFMYLSTNEEYVAVGGAGRPPDPSITYRSGDRARYRFDGSYSSRAIFLDVFYGVTDRIDLGIQVPFFRQQFQDAALLTGFGEPRCATGFSDIRAFMKLGLLTGPTVGSIKLGFKAPTGSFRNEDGLIPVGEGQWDFDFIAQLGRSLWPVRVYANVDLGFRLRMKNKKIDRDPGNEWFFMAELGYSPSKLLMMALEVEGVRGEAATTFGIKTVQDVKRVTYIAPTLSVGPFNNVNLEAALRISVNGRSFPAGKMLVVGASYSGNPFHNP